MSRDRALRPGFTRPRMGRVGWVSLAAHAGVLAALLFGGRLFGGGTPEVAEIPAQVEVVLGNANGNPGAPPTPPPARPDLQTPKPSEPEATAKPPPTPAPQGDTPATQASPPTQPRPAAPPAAPPAPSTPPAVRLGDAGDIANAIIAEPGRTLRAAAADIGNLPPPFPPEAARRHEFGLVGLRLHIAEDGHVDRVEVAHSSGFAVLDAAASEALASWHFTPARQDGHPVADVLDININFSPD